MDPILAQILLWAGALVTIAGAIAVIKNILSPVWRRVKALTTATEQFIQDWQGEPARPGRAAVPGVMQRLNKLDGELSHNGGKSIKDVVNRIEARLEEGNARFERIENELRELRR